MDQGGHWGAGERQTNKFWKRKPRDVPANWGMKEIQRSQMPPGFSAWTPGQMEAPPTKTGKTLGKRVKWKSGVQVVY